MKTRLCQLFLLAALLAAPAYADEVVIDFDTNAPPIPVRVPEYTEDGFTFCCNVLLSYSPAGGVALETNSNHVTLPRTISVTYLGGATFDFLGVDVVFSYGTDVFRGSNGVSVTYTHGLELGTLFQGITWLEWIHYGVGGDFGPSPAVLDNFRFRAYPETAPVPEPATLILLGSGLLGVMGAAGRRRAAGR